MQTRPTRKTSIGVKGQSGRGRRGAAGYKPNIHQGAAVRRWPAGYKPKADGPSSQSGDCRKTTHCGVCAACGARTGPQWSAPACGALCVRAPYTGWMCVGPDPRTHASGPVATVMGGAHGCGAPGPLAVRVDRGAQPVRPVDRRGRAAPRCLPPGQCAGSLRWCGVDVPAGYCLAAVRGGPVRCPLELGWLSGKVPVVPWLGCGTGCAHRPVCGGAPRRWYPAGGPRVETLAG